MMVKNMHAVRGLEQRVDTSINQVFFLYSPLPFPTFFASHCWVVTNAFGTLDRWEVWQAAHKSSTSRGHVHRNLFPPFLALHKNFFVRSMGRRQPRLIAVIEKDQALASDMISFIRQEAFHYPLWHTYRYYPGPNSNTFIQWIIHHFPEYAVSLPKTAIGKNFPIRE